MAALYTQNVTPFSGQYNANTMVHRFTGAFTAHNVLAGQAGINDVLNHRGVGNWSLGNWEAPHAALPLYRTVNHLWTDFVGNTGTQNVICQETQRQAYNTTSADTIEVTVTMEGRMKGTHDQSARTQMTSDILFQSLQPSPDGTFVGLGVDFGGVPRDVPMVVYSVAHCDNLNALDVAQAAADLIAGSVNELDWVPPWWRVGPPGAAEGDYLYLGPTACIIDRNTRSFLMTHEFARLQSRNKQHIFEWYEYTETWDEAAKRTTRVYDPTAYTGYIQKVAGTDVWWDGSTPIPTFATLGLGRLLY